MSTVLLMTDSWQPTVLRLVPFSKNNARSLNSRYQRAHSNSQSQRGFPVLAVTRSGRKPSSSSGYRSATPRSTNSAQSDNTGEQDGASMISDTNVTCSTNRTNVSSGRSSSRYAKKRIPEVHSEMKEAIKFSVQDLNDQTSSISSIHSSDSKGESQDTKSINSRTKLPRPSMMAPSDSMKGQAQTTKGANKFVTLTPGEIELQKYRDAYAMEQVQKKKKYKLNVNQLPRSTTPINDHDPDKLNMKQVIAFLQTKSGNATEKKTPLEKKRDVESRPHQFSDKFIDIKHSIAPQKVASVESISLQNSNSDGRHSDRTGNNRLENSGCVSVMSTKSSPNLPYRSGRQSVKSNASTATSKASVKSERPNRRGDKSKQKEFRLYRFLAIAPDNPIANNFVNPEHVPVLQRLSYKYSSQRDKALGGRAEPSSFNNIPGIKTRKKTTANMIHRRAVNKTGPTTEAAKDSEGAERSIRLPLVTDADSPDDECETCSTTSATCNSAERSPKDGERTAYPKKGKVVTLPEETVDVSHLPDFKQVNKDKTAGSTNGQGFLEQSTNQSESPRMAPINSPRQIHVTMPHAQATRYSQEIVRLTLRQAKNATRVTSYMSDLASDGAYRGDDWKFQSPEDAEGYSANGFTQSIHPENREWVEHSRQFVNNISSNNFIKVRQKLRASNVNNVE